ncbi:DNA mismatch repair protein [Cinnamomum micranthum f. kanehirae]|uniref:DNA mismatch repair protein n=1 Tax=Cinnamomum micranthum f. kanehirae TaxID=337451 RepID=A0A3S3R4K3_9MAGN|nr:DNA mismatch repair protein [Cinnamomum micranthum f. kanehirae]
MDNAADSPTIRPINKGVIHRICSGQVILDLSAAVKELVENSLDAGATSIEISLKKYGVESIKVADNGCGVSPNNFQSLACKHHTSKIADFHDLQSLTTFGFRGEALSSLCALGNLTVETRTKNEPIGTHLEFDHSGLVTSERKTAREIGTTVTVEKLFSTLPVRCNEFSRNARREFGKFTSLLNAYALMARGVRLVCTNTTGKNKSVVLKTPGSSSIKDNIITVFGTSTFACLEPLSLCISESCKVEGFLSKPGYGSGRSIGDRQFFYVNGRPVDMPKVTKLINELYKSSNSRQHPIAIMNFIVPTKAYDVNVTPDKRKIFFSDESSLMLSLKEAMEGIYSSNHCSYAINVMDEPKKEPDAIKLDTVDDEPHISSQSLSPQGISEKEEVDTQLQTADEISLNISKEGVVQDSNVSEDIVCRKEEKPLMKDILHSGPGSEKLKSYSYAQPKKLGALSRLNALIDKHETPHKRAAEKVAVKNLTLSGRSNYVQSSLTKFVTPIKRKHEQSCTTLSELPVLRKELVPCQVKKISSEMHAAGLKSLDGLHIGDDSTQANEDQLSEHCEKLCSSNGVETPLSQVSGAYNSRPGAENFTCQEKASPLPSISGLVSRASFDTDLEDTLDDISRTNPVSKSSNVIFDAPIPSAVIEICSVLQFSINDLRRRRICGMPKMSYAAATLDDSQPENDEAKAKALAAATSELDRFFRKEDFGKMKVIGQFNLGFIIGKIDQDLFIVDQHAADEKYNFERLSQSTIMNQQPLLQPMNLNLSPDEEVIASSHMEIIRKNGFTLIEDLHAPPGHHFLLKAVPFSKNVTFGAEDVKELISTLADSQGECSIIGSYKMDTQDSLCPSRVRAMLASRACRSSVMIGDPLGRKEMQKILKHLAGLKSPWNCPHGRPTMRHLIDLTTIRKKCTQEI